MCTGAIIRDTGSGIVDGQYQLKYDTQGEQGTPCYGDRGTSLMFKEKERYKLTVVIFLYDNVYFEKCFGLVLGL